MARHTAPTGTHTQVDHPWRAVLRTLGIDFTAPL